MRKLRAVILVVMGAMSSLASGCLSQAALDALPQDATLLVLMMSAASPAGGPEGEPGSGLGSCEGVLCDGVEIRLDSVSCVGMQDPRFIVDDNTVELWAGAGWQFDGIQAVCDEPSGGWFPQDRFDEAASLDLRGEHEVALEDRGLEGGALRLGVRFDEDLEITDCDFPRCQIVTRFEDFFVQRGR